MFKILVRWAAGLLIAAGFCLCGAEIDPPWWPLGLISGPFCLASGMLLAVWYDRRWPV